jgi:hypothetical protein
MHGIFINTAGNITPEYIMLTGCIFITICAMASIFGEANEMNLAMAAARSGATEGALVNTQAIYPEETFSDYIDEQSRLLIPSNVKILKIDYKNQGYSPVYNRTKIQLKIFASTTSGADAEERNSLGDRINFYVRKSICQTFKTQNLTNTVFNPAFSQRYIFTTADVHWV